LIGTYQSVEISYEWLSARAKDEQLMAEQTDSTKRLGRVSE
jgi:hypothetical protein